MNQKAAGKVGAGIGLVAGPAAVATLGVPGISAVGLTTGLAALGGTMIGGIILLPLLPIMGYIAFSLVFREDDAA
jgi:hypothetical protein